MQQQIVRARDDGRSPGRYPNKADCSRSHLWSRSRSQAHKNGDISLTDSVLMSGFSEVAEVQNESEPPATSLSDCAAKGQHLAKPDMPCPDGVTLPLTCECFCAAQRMDPTLEQSLSNVVIADKASGE